MNETQYIRELAANVHEIAISGEMNRRRKLWSDHNSLTLTPPPVYVRAFAAPEVPELNDLRCTDEYARGLERHFKTVLYRASLGDDSVHEPWYAVRAAFVTPHQNRWGPPITVTRPVFDGKGAFSFNPAITGDNDIGKLVKPRHEIDEAKTAEIFERASEMLYGVLPVVVDRSPLYSVWNGDISTDLAYLLGLEGMMLAMCDRPEWLHKIVKFMGDGIKDVQDEAEAAGDFPLFSQLNQAVPYANELPPPSSDANGVTRDKLWAFCASQETATVSPAMWEEFILRYQKPIYEKYGLLSYGCCEDMTLKFPIVKRELKNLRRVAVTPWADLRSCSEQLGSDYIFSWRPSPAETVSFGFDCDHVKKITREAFGLARENRNHIDVTLKDVETTSGRPESVRDFVQAVREVIEEGSWAW